MTTMRTIEELVLQLERIADLLELSGENVFRCNAYRNAARTAESWTGTLDGFVDAAASGKQKGFGPQLTLQLKEYASTGAISFLGELEQSLPAGVLELFKVPGLGPKKLRLIREELQIESLEALETACREGRLRGLKGFGIKTEEKLLAGVCKLRERHGSVLLREALLSAERMQAVLRTVPGISDAHIAGEVRRSLPVIQELVLVVETGDRDAALSHVCERLGLEEPGAWPIGLRLSTGLKVTVHATLPASLGGALVRETGSASHFSWLTALAAERKQAPDKLLNVRDEAAIYEALGLPFIPPELREGLFEEHLAATRPAALTALVVEDDLKGVLHTHTTYSDGAATIEELASAVRELGFEYLGVSDHSQSAGYAGGLPPARVVEQQREIDRLNKKLAPFRIFKGIESDILADGSLDYEDDILATFDFIVASVHSRFSLGEEPMTARMLRAIANPFTTILGHPTGRLLLRRDPYAVDVDALIAGAARAGTAIELNSNPNRLDLDWRKLQQAVESGVPISINPDAHSLSELSFLEVGTRMAQKGGLQSADVLNTRGVREIERYFVEKRARRAPSC